MGVGLIARAVGLIALAASAAPAGADAAFPGNNGNIAFEADRDSNGKFEIYSMNADGTGEIPLTNEPGTSFTGVGWSPDGKKVGFACHGLPNHDFEVCVANADGSGLVAPFAHWGDVDDVAWSPDGTAVAFRMEEVHCPFNECELDTDIGRVNLDGSGFAKVTDIEYTFEVEPNWSPDGSNIAWNFGGCCGPEYRNYSPDGSKFTYSRFTGGDDEIFVSNADSTGEVQLTSNTVNDSDPAWSPDGKKITFTSDEGGDYEIFTMNADGTGRQALTNNSVTDRAPDWQPIPINGYARPRGATPFQVWLAVAYKECTSPNREHGGPLTGASCAPPVQASDFLTVGTLDANGVPAKAIGSVQAFVKLGNPATPADEADVKLLVSVTDVRNKSDLTDYAGELLVTSTRRITDKNNTPSPGGPGAATTQDFPFAFTVPCAPTADTSIGSLCSIQTTADSVVPGQVKEEVRSNWQLGQVRVDDGGADGDADTADNTPFMDAGIFVP